MRYCTFLLAPLLGMLTACAIAPTDTLTPPPSTVLQTTALVPQAAPRFTGTVDITLKDQSARQAQALLAQFAADAGFSFKGQASELARTMFANTTVEQIFSDLAGQMNQVAVINAEKAEVAFVPTAQLSVRIPPALSSTVFTNALAAQRISVEPHGSEFHLNVSARQLAQVLAALRTCYGSDTTRIEVYTSLLGHSSNP